MSAEEIQAPAWIVRSDVMHQRHFPMRYRFRYAVTGCLVDIDRLDEIERACRWFSVDRFNLFSLRTRDHGRRDGTAWRGWIEDRLLALGIALQGGRIRLLMLPRILGLAFNPLSVWYCEDLHGRLRAILLEVRNTFGEHHHYVLHAEGGGPLPWPVRGEKTKGFHVSPFIGMHARYRFLIGDPGRGPRIGIREYEGENLMLVASQTGSLVPCNDRQILLEVLRAPLAGLRVLFLIHWQALRIWLLGGKYHSRPTPPREEIS